MLRMGGAGLRSRRKAPDPHLAHIVLDAFAIDRVPFALQLGGHPP